MEQATIRLSRERILAKDVMPKERRNRTSPIYEPADDRHTLVVVVLRDRGDQGVIAAGVSLRNETRSIAIRIEGEGSFHQVPAIIAAALNNVDFFNIVLTHVGRV